MSETVHDNEPMKNERSDGDGDLLDELTDESSRPPARRFSKERFVASLIVAAIIGAIAGLNWREFGPPTAEECDMYSYTMSWAWGSTTERLLNETECSLAGCVPVPTSSYDDPYSFDEEYTVYTCLPPDDPRAVAAAKEEALQDKLSEAYKSATGWETCEEIAYGASYDRCAEMLFDKGAGGPWHSWKEQHCERVSDHDTAQDCWYRAALYRSEPALCDRLDRSFIYRDHCFHRSASKIGDKSACEKIDDEKSREFCLAMCNPDFGCDDPSQECTWDHSYQHHYCTDTGPCVKSGGTYAERACTCPEGLSMERSNDMDRCYDTDGILGGEWGANKRALGDERVACASTGGTWYAGADYCRCADGSPPDQETGLCIGSEGKPVYSDEVTECDEKLRARECYGSYHPVCAFVRVECFTTPCDPVREDYRSPACACDNERVTSYTEGPCR